jgi:hypothetical protein
MGMKGGGRGGARAVSKGSLTRRSPPLDLRHDHGTDKDIHLRKG